MGKLEKRETGKKEKRGKKRNGEKRETGKKEKLGYKRNGK